MPARQTAWLSSGVPNPPSPRLQRAAARYRAAVLPTLRPMLLTAGPLPPEDDPAFSYELKWDGYRAVAAWDGLRLRLRSRHGSDLTDRFGDALTPGAQQLPGPAVLDGEIVALRDDGLPCFGLLQQHRAPAHRLRYVVFDLLHLGDQPWRNAPYTDRREQLLALGIAGCGWDVPPAILRRSDALAAATALGIEGVVAKRVHAPYRPGERCRSWIKRRLVQRVPATITAFSSAGSEVTAVDLAVRQGSTWCAIGSAAVAGELASPLLRRLAPLARTRTADRCAVEPLVVVDVAFRCWALSGRIVRGVAVREL